MFSAVTVLVSKLIALMYRTRAALQLLQRRILPLKTSKVITRNKNIRKEAENIVKNENTKRHYASTTSVSNQQATAAAAKAESFLSGSNSLYVEDMYESWLEDPNSVHKVTML